ncbi:hypothetical protein PM082_009918 [Marasmius tenuissimus]|nr:hypothetical protein PM082_009918 [Marasmius tenuissimus]
MAAAYQLAPFPNGKQNPGNPAEEGTSGMRSCWVVNFGSRIGYGSNLRMALSRVHQGPAHKYFLAGDPGELQEEVQLAIC